jgi:hypothetical protein
LENVDNNNKYHILTDNINLPGNIKDAVQSETKSWNKKIRASSRAFLKVLFEINKYEDDILNSRYKPTKNSQGVVQLEDTYYESDEDSYMQDTESITPDKPGGEQCIPGSCYSVGDVKKLFTNFPPTNCLQWVFICIPKVITIVTVHVQKQ